MIITKLEVEEGFLDGLSVAFAPGLNVIIGPRGVGKTSLIELLRFAFGVPGYTDRSNSAAIEHARSVLGGGRVTVTAEHDSETITFVRGAADSAPRVVSASPSSRPIVLSQNEVEQIGLEPISRVRLVDGFRSAPSAVLSAEESAESMVASLTAEIQTVARSGRAAFERSLSMADVTTALEEALLEESRLSESVQASEPDRIELQELSKAAAALEVRRDALDKSRELAIRWIKALTDARSRAPELQFPTTAGDRVAIVLLESAIAEAAGELDRIAERLTTSSRELVSESRASQTELVVVQDKARDLRRRVEGLVEGAGKAAQRVAGARTKLAQREVLLEEAAEHQLRMERLRSQRTIELSKLATARERRSTERVQVAARINDSLGPVVHVRVDRDAGLDGYVSAIADLLQGSGLHYNSLAPQLAARLSPREFVELVEAGDAAQLAGIAGLTEDRAVKIVASADRPTLQRVLTARIDDSIEITLLDESVPKSTQSLSTGQRCTAVLPILLLHEDRILILDQPEDHLDNAYVVKTLVRSLSTRSKSAQTIVATHNANIPVLGGAARVILLGSDGKRGFVRLAAPLDSPEVVSAISQVMEGGAEAFRLRANFYEKYLA